MQTVNLSVGQVVPLTAAMKNLQGRPCATPTTLDWTNSNTAAVQLTITSTTTGATAIAPGTAIIGLAGEGFVAEMFEINVARPSDGGVTLSIIAGTPH